jgi:hypothetical protein
MSGMVSVYSGRVCLGFVIERGREGFEAYDQQERSLGLFKTQEDAAAAVMRSAGGVEPAQSDQRA